MSTRYMDLLNEQQGYLDENYNLAQEVLDILDGLANEEKSDEDKIALLKSLKKGSDELFSSLINLRINNINSIESYNTKMKIGPSSDVAKSKLKVSPTDLGNPDNLYNYLKELRLLNFEWMKHLKLLNDFSTDMSFPIANQEGTDHIVVNREHFPAELLPVLERYDQHGEAVDDTMKLRSEMMQYFENIRSTRAKYHLENKYLIATSLKELTKSVAAWSSKWENLESLLFGDNPNSIRKLLQSVQSIKASIPQESKMDVEME
ncbi:HEL093Cp [Eremothecium sinecaudum]|uniref:HEL093Cp n=1 Tax=Eremothecium sinecaudum TaxID=45286 RepID=A0A0X8HTE9_9SACH|nr:HEL093Cp [Eremothecium sinecaudum]AMD21187.1 HEL093Cp [Eremothecium sinecaudum]